MSSEYTCTDPDGAMQDGVSPPLVFANPPVGTVQYLLLMWSVYGRTGQQKYNFVVYGIDGGATGIDAGCSVDGCSAGVVGGTYPGEPVEYKYKAPCASTSGTHAISFTLYALSGDIVPYVRPGETDKMPELLEVAEDRGFVLSQTTTSLSYCTCGCTSAASNAPPPHRALDAFCEKNR